MKHYSIAVILCVLTILLGACRPEDTDLRQIGSQKKMVLYCFPMNSDSTLIQLTSSNPVGEEIRLNDYINDAQVTLSVNGIKTSILKDEGFYIKNKLKTNDRIDLSITAAGLPDISAHTVIPDAFPLESVKMEPDAGNSNYLQFQITFKDNALKNDYYGIQVQTKTDYYEYKINSDSTLTQINYKSKITNGTLDIEKEPLLNNLSDLDKIVGFVNDFYQNFYIWEDKKIQGRTYTLKAKAIKSVDSEYKDDSDLIKHVYKYSYRVNMYKLSEEAYRFLKALNDQYNNQLGKSGLSFINPNYSNVQNGLGVLGGMNRMQTEWMKLTK